jgi:hypothetical protein
MVTTPAGYAATWRASSLKRDKRVVYASVAALAGLVLILSATSVPVPFGSRKGPEGVVNGSAAMGLSGWSAASDAGTVVLAPAGIGHGPGDARTAVDIQRTAGNGRWAMAVADIRTPQRFFRVGRTYQMQAYARDLNASGESIGILLANDNYVHRPTTEARYGKYHDRSWHLLTRRFVCRESASPDTRFYFELPASGALHWQVTAVSVREVPRLRPPKVGGSPDRKLSFAGTAGSPPDGRVWTHELGGHGWANREVQTYTSGTANAHLDGQGHLVISVRREDVVGSDGIRRPYTSARISTKGKVEIPPGSYLEAAIRPPVGRGLYPAFWLLGSAFPDVGWPAAGELDVLEMSGQHASTVHSRMHLPASSNPDEDAPYPRDSAVGTVDLGHPLDSRAHRYGVYFDDRMVRFYVDRKEHLAFDAQDAAATGRGWPFDKPLEIVLNVAVRGDVSGTSFPRSMVVGDISVWEGGTPF